MQKMDDAHSIRVFSRLSVKSRMPPVELQDRWVLVRSGVARGGGGGQGGDICPWAQG